VGDSRFTALIFCEKTATATWELAGSKISKLGVQHSEADLSQQPPTTRQIVLSYLWL
jgi:hypothetical protein